VTPDLFPAYAYIAMVSVLYQNKEQNIHIQTKVKENINDEQ
jgi:hypothetical protein